MSWMNLNKDKRGGKIILIQNLLLTVTLNRRKRHFHLFGLIKPNLPYAIPSPPELHRFPSFFRLSLHIARLLNCHKLFNGLIKPFLTLLHPPFIANEINSLTAKNGGNTGSSPLPFIPSYSNANVLAAWQAASASTSHLALLTACNIHIVSATHLFYRQACICSNCIVFISRCG